MSWLDDILNDDGKAECPYCHYENDYREDKIYEEDATEELECYKCERPFYVRVSVSYSWYSGKIEHDENEAKHE